MLAVSRKVAVQYDVSFVYPCAGGDSKRNRAVAQSKCRTRLEAWLSGDLLKRFADRILDSDQEIADRWGHLSGARGATIPVIDELCWLQRQSITT